jgi:carbonic anhydrase/acetyltransferase-like protein (isoleucine patch superfamily)
MHTPDDLFQIPYLTDRPQLDAPPRHVGPGAVVIGRVTLGGNAWLGAGSVIRADGHYVRAGADLQLGRGATVHIAHDVYPTLIGEHVTVGDRAVVHACEVGDDCVIEDGAVLLDGSVTEAGVVLEAGAVVFPRARLAGGHLYGGRPARSLRALGVGELEQRRAALRRRNAARADQPRPLGDQRAQADPTAFIALTAIVRGRLVANAHSSIWYGCELDAADGEILIDDRANVQDNSLLTCSGRGRISIGADTTIGHNVTLPDCTIGARCLIGIGSVLAPGTVAEDDTFLAAGATTTPNQVLKGGLLWGGQPARVLGALDDRKRELIRTTIVTYCGYADELARRQRELATA